MKQHYWPIQDLGVFDLENSFYLRSDVSRLGKLLSHYELYKGIVNVPGSIVECGVYKGTSLVRWATFRHCLETDESRGLLGFDVFGAFPTDGLASKDDQDFAKTHDELAGSRGISSEGLKRLLQEKGFRNFTLIEGNVMETVQRHFDRHDHERIALLHLDMDVFEPTLHVLEQLWEKVVTGGVVIVDDYSAVGGATRATDEFTRRHGIRIQKGPYYAVPSFFIK